MVKKLTAAATLALAFAAGAFVSAQARDWHDVDAVHTQVVQCLNQMERIRAANHYDMQGHGVKAEQHLRAAEQELELAVQAARGR